MIKNVCIACFTLLSLHLLAQSGNIDLITSAKPIVTEGLFISSINNSITDEKAVLYLESEEQLELTIGEPLIFNSNGESSPSIRVESGKPLNLGLFDAEGELIRNKRLRKTVEEIQFIGLDEGRYILILQDR